MTTEMTATTRMSGIRRRGAVPTLVGVCVILLSALAVPHAASATTQPPPPEAPVVDPSLEAKIADGSEGPVPVLARFAADADATAAAEDISPTAEPLDAAVPLVATSVDAAGLDALRDAPGLVSISEDRQHTVDLATSVGQIDAPDAWAAGYDGTGARIAVLDTGVLQSHPFLTGQIDSEACFSGDSSDSWSSGYCPGGNSHQALGSGAAAPCDDHLNSQPVCWHGTHVAGILVGHDGPSSAPSGVAPGAQLVAVQVFSRTPNGQVSARDSDLLEAMDWVVAQQNSSEPIVALNMSLSGGTFPTACDNASVGDAAIKSEVDLLRANGITVVAAAGNAGDKDGVGSPACISNIVAVGATDDALGVTSFSNSSPMLDVLAPGSFIKSSMFSFSGSNKIANYGEVSGTSMASPHVAAAIAVLAQARGPLPPATMEQLLERSGVDITDSANGRTTPLIQIDAARLMKLAPIGVIETASVSGNQTRLTGWAVDPDSPAAATIEVRVGGVPNMKASAGDARPDVFTDLGPLGKDHGFDVSITDLPKGPHSVCVGALDTATSVRTSLGCRTLQVNSGPPKPTPAFSDVAPGSTFFEAVNWLATQNVTTGYPDGGFHPTAPVSRQALVAMLYRLAGSPSVALPGAPTFADVGIGSPFRTEIEWAAAEGIVNGFSDGTFHPTEPISREAFAAMLHRSVGKPAVTLPTPATFSDVPASHPFAKPIQWLASSGITDGNADGTFGTSAQLTREALAAFLARQALALP